MILFKQLLLGTNHNKTKIFFHIEWLIEILFSNLFLQVPLTVISYTHCFVMSRNHKFDFFNCALISTWLLRRLVS